GNIESWRPLPPERKPDFGRLRENDYLILEYSQSFGYPNLKIMCHYSFQEEEKIYVFCFWLIEDNASNNPFSKFFTKQINSITYFYQEKINIKKIHRI